LKLYASLPLTSLMDASDTHIRAALVDVCPRSAIRHQAMGSLYLSVHVGEYTR